MPAAPTPLQGAVSAPLSPALTQTGLTLTPLAGALGAEVRGADLSDLERWFEPVRRALLEHRVVYLPDQSALQPRQLRDFAARFGALQTHPAYPTVDDLPEVTHLAYDREHRSKVDSWHSDMTFRARPPIATMLHAQTVPERGGDTLFACMKTAWEALSPPWQRMLDGLEAVHSFAHGFKESLAEPGGYERLKGAIDDNPPVAHPLVVTHPETGERGLFVNEVFTTHIVGMNPAESRATLAFLFEHCRTPEFTARVRWQPGGLAIWDNRITLHRPVNDYWPGSRAMHRVVVLG